MDNGEARREVVRGLQKNRQGDGASSVGLPMASSSF